MPYPKIERLSPNRDAAPANERRGVVFHHSQMGFDDSIEFMLRPEAKASYHCLISPSGAQCTLVPDAQIAWHAGASRHGGRDRCNDFMLGVAFAGDTYREPLTSAQLASAIEWLAERWDCHGWTVDCMTDHRQVSPGRKEDLNPVEWARLRGAILARFTP